LFKSTAPADAMIDWLVTILLVSDAMVGCRRTFVLLIGVDGWLSIFVDAPFV
jgi:hypothetical protein